MLARNAAHFSKLLYSYIRNLKQRAQGLQTFAFYIVNLKKEVGVKFKDCLCAEL